MLANRLRMSSAGVGDGILWVYNEGIEYITIIHAYSLSGGRFTKRPDHIELRGDRNGAVVHMGTDTKVDVTGINTIYIDWERILHSYPSTPWVSAYSDLMLVDVRTGSVMSDEIHARYQIGGSGPFSRQVNSLDVSNLSGSFYIRVGLTTYSGGNMDAVQRIYRIWLE